MFECLPWSKMVLMENALCCTLRVDFFERIKMNRTIGDQMKSVVTGDSYSRQSEHS